MKSILIFFLFYILPVCCFGQYSVNGVVFYKEGPMLFSTVSLHTTTEAILVKDAITNEDGKFHFDVEIPGAYFVSVQYVGFERQHSKEFVISNNTQCVDLDTLFLQESVNKASQRKFNNEEESRVGGT